MKNEILIVKCLDDLLDHKSQDSKKTEEDLIKKILDENKVLKKDLNAIRAIGFALRTKKDFPNKTKREIIALVLEELGFAN